MRKTEAGNPNADLFSRKPNAQKPARVYTVSELTQEIKQVLEGAFGVVRVEGEVSGVSRIATGTIFFSLKDENCVLQCVVFFSQARSLAFELKEGMRLICSGRVSAYEKTQKSQYQLYVETLEPKGVGAMQLALEQLKVRLEREGLFKPERKRPIPYLPRRIGVVTSVHGAAIKDIFKVLDRRFKEVHLVVRSARVQGELAKEDIAAAIDEMNEYNQAAQAEQRIDVLIVGRGGGSIEDLWAFNEEVVARAIFRSRIPVISAVGHERDWTIADLVADLRAPTPSVAAELVIPKREDLRERLESLVHDMGRSLEAALFDTREQLDETVRRLTTEVNHRLELHGAVVDAAAKKLRLLNPVAMIAAYREKITVGVHELGVRMTHFIELRGALVRGAVAKLQGLSPLGCLSRGYSIAFRVSDGSIIKDAQGISPGEVVRTQLSRGEITSCVTEVKRDA